MSRNVALVLSSGSARGFAHIGAIHELTRMGFHITSVAGASMGALVGGIYATGQLDLLEEWVCSLDMKDVLKLTDFSISKKGLVKGKKVIEKMKEIIPDRNIEDLPIPFCAVATDILNEQEICFTRGKLYDAIRASISIPTVFQPFEHPQGFYVDGGVLNPIPIDRVERQDGDILVVVNVNARIPDAGSSETRKESPEARHQEKIDRIQSKLNNIIPKSQADHLGLFNLTTRSINLMVNRISNLTLERHQPDLTISVSRSSFGSFDFYKAREIIKEGETIAREAILKYLDRE